MSIYLKRLLVGTGMLLLYSSPLSVLLLLMVVLPQHATAIAIGVYVVTLAVVLVGLGFIAYLLGELREK